MDEVAGAIADAVRRDILVMLRGGPLSAGEIAARFQISRPAVSRHLRVLRESGLVRDELVGRRRLYELVAGRFTELAAWLEPFLEHAEPHAGPSAWEHHLDALETEVHRTRRERRTREAAAGEATASKTTADDTRENTA